MSFESHQTKYEMGRLLGRGHFAQVFLAVNIQTKETVAIKVYIRFGLFYFILERLTLYQSYINNAILFAYYAQVIDKTNLVDSADVNAEIDILRHIGEHTHVVTLLDVFGAYLFV